MIFKLALVLPTVLLEPDTFWQLTAVAAVEAVQLLWVCYTQGFTNLWLNALTRGGSLHNVALLCLVCAYRVTLISEPSNTERVDLITKLMFGCIGLYVIFLLWVILRVVIWPAFHSPAVKEEKLVEVKETVDVEAVSAQPPMEVDVEVASAGSP